MPKIFVSYRRVDSEERAHRIADWLIKNYYDKEDVFIDIEAIDVGLPFAEVIQQGIRDADVVLVIIGNQWVDEL